MVVGARRARGANRRRQASPVTAVPAGLERESISDQGLLALCHQRLMPGYPPLYVRGGEQYKYVSP